MHINVEKSQSALNYYCTNCIQQYGNIGMDGKYKVSLHTENIIELFHTNFSNLNSEIICDLLIHFKIANINK